jgi:hypothetical protein
VKPISFDDFRPAPGLLTEWRVGPQTSAAAVSVPAGSDPLSYNQELHLRSAHAAQLAGLPGNPWVGAAFELQGAVQADALGQAFESWVRRHDALRGGFRIAGPGVERFTVPAGQVVLVQEEAVGFASPDDLHAYLGNRFAEGTDPFAWPPLVMGAISRDASTTVFIAMDHVAADGYSLALAVWELQTRYEALLQGAPPVLPEAGSFLEFCAAERDFGAGISVDDPAVAVWRDLVRACGGTAPTFPLDLGVEAGQAWPQRVYNRCLLRPEEAEAFAAACRDSGGSVFAGLLACMALAVRAMTGEQDFHTVTPLHTRSRPQWRPAMGWFITCAPLSFSLEGALSFTEALERAQCSVQGAVRLARYPALRVIELLGDDFRITRRDLFSMVSFTDYRKMPGADRHAESNPVTIGRVTEADDSHVWLSRQHDGLHISIRHPDTPVAGDVLDEYTRLIRDAATRVLLGSDPLLAPATALAGA